MRAIVYFGLLISSISCTALENKQSESKIDTVLIKAPSVSEERELPSKNPLLLFPYLSMMEWAMLITGNLGLIFMKLVRLLNTRFKFNQRN